MKSEKEIAEYIIDRILKGYVFFLGDENIIKIQEKHSSIRFERIDIEVNLRKYNTKSKLYFIKKDDKLKNFSSDIWTSVGANWETLFGFYFENGPYIKVHVYYIGEEFDLDKLSDMIYGLFTDEKNHIKIGKIAFKYGKDTKILRNAKALNEEFEHNIIKDIMDNEKNTS